MGRFGEKLSARFLQDHGLRILASNVAVDGGEIDLLADDSGTRVAVEVRTTTGHHDDPIDAVSVSKRMQVQKLARSVRAERVDYVGVRLGTTHVDFHWVQV